MNRGGYCWWLSLRGLATRLSGKKTRPNTPSRVVSSGGELVHQSNISFILICEDLVVTLFAPSCHELTQRGAMLSRQHLSMRARMGKRVFLVVCIGDLGYSRNRRTPTFISSHQKQTSKSQVGRCALKRVVNAPHSSHHETTQPCKRQQRNPRDTYLRGTGAKSRCSACSATKPLLARYAFRVDCKLTVHSFFSIEPHPRLHAGGYRMNRFRFCLLFNVV